MTHQEYKISGVSVLFPCKPYPSQFSMMDKILKGIDRRQNCLLESPTGSGKSLALLCSSLSWQAAEKAKKELEDAQEFEKAQCACTCHAEKASTDSAATANPDGPKEKSGGPEQSKASETSGKDNKFGWPTFDFENQGDIDDEDDFKMDGKSLNLPSKKNPRNHISISYEDEHKTPEKKKEVCGLCECEPDNPEGKTKTKIPKIYFGTRTHRQVAQIVRELRKTAYGNCKMTILGSREHTCIHPQVSKMKNKNDGCKDLLNDQGGCRFKDATPRLTSQRVIKDLGLDTAWDLEDLVGLCKAKRACPYFLSRGLKDDSDIIICPYNYLVDPMIREAMMINIKGHIIILDEAHNIEDSAREAASQSIAQDSILKGIKDIEGLIEQNINFADHSKLRSMLKNLDSFIDENKGRLEQKDFNKSYKIWSGFYIVAQLENLGLGPKFYPDLKKALMTIKAELEERKEEASRIGLNQDLVQMKPATLNLLDQVFQVLEYLYRADLKYVDDYRASLVQSFQYVPRTEEGQWLNSRNRYGGRNMMQVELYTLNFWCMNPGVAFSDFADTRSIILTSGTLSPLTSFESELGLEFKIQLEANHVIKDSQAWVGTLGQGPGGGNLQAVFRNLETFTFQDELGSVVLKVCQTVPHGVLCFLPSYKVLEKLITRWELIGLMQKIAAKKRIISEPRGSDKLDFEEQMKLFYDAVQPRPDGEGDSGEDEPSSVDGAIFFAVCRGKVSEGLDFADNFARAVITVGIPYPNFKDVQVELKRKYNDQHRVSKGLLSGSDWYEIQAFRALNQALGRCIRHRQDWGALIIVDDRFVKNPAKYSKGLSKWVRNKIQNFYNFSCAMDSLSLFTQNMIDTQQQNDSSLGTSVLGSSPSPRKPLHTVNTPATPKSNFPIFSIFQTPTSLKPAPNGKDKIKSLADSPAAQGSPTVISANNRKGSLISTTPSGKLAERIRNQLFEKASKPRFSYHVPAAPASSKLETTQQQQQSSAGKDGASVAVAASWPASTFLASLTVGHEPAASISKLSSTATPESLPSGIQSAEAAVCDEASEPSLLPGTDVLKQTKPTAESTTTNITTATTSSTSTSSTSSSSSWKTFQTHPLPAGSDFSSTAVQLRVITERAAPGERFRVFEIPAELHGVFGGNLNLPVSTSERLVYLVDPPPQPGLNPTARLIRMGEQEKEEILKTQGLGQAVAHHKEQSGDNTTTKQVSSSKCEDKTASAVSDGEPPKTSAAQSKTVLDDSMKKILCGEAKAKNLLSANAVKDLLTSKGGPESVHSVSALPGTSHVVSGAAQKVTTLSSSLGVINKSAQPAQKAAASHQSSATSTVVTRISESHPFFVQASAINGQVMTGVALQVTSTSGRPDVQFVPIQQNPGAPPLLLAAPGGLKPLSSGAPTLIASKVLNGVAGNPVVLASGVPTQQKKGNPVVPAWVNGTSQTSLEPAAVPTLLVQNSHYEQASATASTSSPVLCSSLSPVLFTPSQSPHTPSPLTNITRPAVPTSGAATNNSRRPIFKPQSAPRTNAAHKQHPLSVIPTVCPTSSATTTTATFAKTKLAAANVRRAPPKSAATTVATRAASPPSNLDKSEVVIDVNAEEADQVKRRIKGKKRKSLSGPKPTPKKSKEETVAYSTASSAQKPMGNTVTCSVFKCSKCGHKLITGRKDADVQEQRTTPPFLRDASCSGAQKSGCFFFPTNTSRAGLQPLTDPTHGTNTKYVEQEEICVQFLYCGQCVKSGGSGGEPAQDQAQAQPQVVGAQVQLAAGSGARFSKGQMWLFYNGVTREKEH